MTLPKLDPPAFKLPFTHALGAEPSVEESPFSALDSYVSKISQQPPDELEDTLNKIVAAMAMPNTEAGFKEAIQNIEEARAYQESMVLQTVIQMKNFDFLEDVCRYNNSLSKDFLQKASISETYDYCNEKFNHFHNRCNSGKDSQSHSEMQLEDHIFYEGSKKLKRKPSSSCWMDEELDDYQTNKKDDFSETLGDEMDGSLTPVEDCKSRKFVYYSSNKKLVFGFDKVENLIDDNVIEDTNRDILKELDHNINFDHPCYKNSGF